MPLSDEDAFLEITKAMHNLSSMSQDAFERFWNSLDLDDYASAKAATIEFVAALLYASGSISETAADAYFDGRADE